MDTDRNLFFTLASVLVGFGCLMVHSASITSWPTEFEQVYLSRHLIFLALGIGVCAICASLPSRFWHHLGPLLYLLTLGLLVLVLVPGIGTRVNGAQRWFRFGSVSFQPSELAKIALPLVMARLVVKLREKDWLRGWILGTIPVLIPVVLLAPLVALQPDLGTALFLVTGTAVLLFLGEWPIRNFLFGISAAVPAAMYLVALKPYQMQRITGYLDTWQDLSLAPYQLKQSLVSLGLGGTHGVGLGKGWQKLSFLPEANTDFVFAVIGEELGLLGTLSLVVLWMALFLSGLWLLRRLDRASFSWLAGVTLLSQLVLQAAMNVAVVTAVIPPKGISHPLISYGGSNLVVSLMALGIIVSLARGEETPLRETIQESAQPGTSPTHDRLFSRWLS